MRKKIQSLVRSVVGSLLVFLAFTVLAQDQNSVSWPYDSLHIPQAISSNNTNTTQPIVIAVIDDGFRLTHQAIQEFIYRNPKEIPDNRVDDDGNGYIDDVLGWDISDGDSNVAVAEGLEKVFFHGTYITSVIAEVAKRHFGERASNRIRILPVKVLSDAARRTYIQDGYKGVRYAMENGADIICMAWSGGEPSKEELNILQTAAQQGILLIGSAGNLQREEVDYPAKSPEVLAVTGVNQRREKQTKASYGLEVNLAAPAEEILGAHPEKDNAYILEQNTSPAAALVTGVAGILLASRPGSSPPMLKEALINTANPLTRQPQYGGKLGAGTIHLERALAYLSQADQRATHFSSLRPRGTLLVDRQQTQRSWRIQPPGGYHGFRLEPDISRVKKPARHRLEIVVADTLWKSTPFSELPKQLFVPAQSFEVQIRQQKSFKKDELFKLHYRGEPIDSTQLYCSGTRYLKIASGQIDDGSGNANYTNNCSCKWVLSVPEGQRIRFTFERMDTEGNVDFVYLTDGQTAIPERIFAKFSGNSIPPVVTSRTNEVLVWFVTDGQNTGDGWSFRWEAVD